MFSYRNCIIIHAHFFSLPPLPVLCSCITSTSTSLHYLATIKLMNTRGLIRKWKGKGGICFGHWLVISITMFFLIRRVILIRFQLIIYINTYDSCRGTLSHTHTKVHLHSCQHTQTCTQTQAHISWGCLSLFAVVAFQVFFFSSHGEFASLVNFKRAAVTQLLSKTVSVDSSVAHVRGKGVLSGEQMSCYHCQSPSLV